MTDENNENATESISTSTEAFVRIDQSGRILEADRYAFFNARPQEILGRDVGDFLPVTIREWLHKKLMCICIGQDQPHAVIEAFDARCGEWFEYHLFPTQAGIILLIRNLTAYERLRERPQEVDSRERQLERVVKEESEQREKLKTATDRLQMALSAAKMATSEYDLKTGTLSFSDGIEDVFGVPAEFAPRTPAAVRQWMPFDEDYWSFSAILEAATGSGEEYKAEFRVKNPATGEIRWIENRGRVLRDDLGRPIRIYGIAQDITETKSVQDELRCEVEERTKRLNVAARTLRQSEERVGIALRNAHIAISMVDLNLRYTWLYHPFLPDADRYIGQPAESFLAPDDAAKMNSLRQHVLNTGKGIREELKLVITGQEYFYVILMEPLKTEAGEIEGVTTLGLDITERKRIEEKLQALNAALERRAGQLRDLSIELTRAEERERRRFAAMLHDHLQQILVGAKLSIKSMLGRPLDDTFPSQMNKLAAIIDEAIEASRSLTAEVAPPVLYQSGLPEALQWLSRWVEEKHGLVVSVKTDERPNEVAQEIRVVLFQAVKELLFNVVKHARVQKAEVVLCYGDKDAIAVLVRDEGVGFDLEKLAGSAETVGGFGLMALRERLNAMGGTMEVVSSPGQGTTTTIKVPTQLACPSR